MPTIPVFRRDKASLSGRLSRCVIGCFQAPAPGQGAGWIVTYPESQVTYTGGYISLSNTSEALSESW